MKSVKQSQPRGAKASPNEKSNREALAQREGAKSAGSRSKESPTATTAAAAAAATTRDEHNVGVHGSRGPGKTSADATDKRRGRSSRLTRLTGRTSSGERGKGKVAGPHQPQQQLVAHAADARSRLETLSADSSSSAHRETNSPVVPRTPERGLAEPDKGFTAAASAKEKSHGGLRFTFS